MGCPLSCAYCINDLCHSNDPADIQYNVTPEELFDLVKIDNLYFQATNGGITFGGGEPGLYSEFIEEFTKIMSPAWKINLETSLNYPQEHLRRLMPVINHFYVDIKTLDKDMYRQYTGGNIQPVLENLELLKAEGLAEKTTVRTPHIPEYTTFKADKESQEKLKEMGFNDLETLWYVKDKNVKEDKNGKLICDLLKAYRSMISKQENKPSWFKPCSYNGPCCGTCSLCDKEITSIQMNIDPTYRQMVVDAKDFPKPSKKLATEYRKIGTMGVLRNTPFLFPLKIEEFMEQRIECFVKELNDKANTY